MAWNENLRWLEIVFIFPRLVLKIISKYNSVYRIGVKFTTEINEMFYLLPWQPYNAFSWALKIEICKCKNFCRADERKKPYFYTISLLNFSNLQNFKKSSIDTVYGIWQDVYDLSCHQKFEKSSPNESANIGARSWKYGKSHGRHGRLDLTLRMREVVQALKQVPTRMKPTAFHPDVFSVKKRYVSVRLFYGLQEK